MKFPFISVALSQLFSKPSTELYPKVKKEVADGYRGRIVFHPESCINCGMCIRVCSPGSIIRTVEKCEDGDHITMEFHMDSCTFCQMCADFCSRNSIELTKDYSIVATDPKDLVVSGSFVKKAPPKKTPEELAALKAKAEAAKAAKAKAEAPAAEPAGENCPDA